MIDQRELAEQVADEQAGAALIGHVLGFADMTEAELDAACNRPDPNIARVLKESRATHKKRRKAKK